MYPHGRSDETVKKGIRGWTENLRQDDHYLKVLVHSASQKIVAFAKWHLVADASSRNDRDRPYESSSAGQEANDNAWQAMDKAKHAMHRKFVAGQAHMCRPALIDRKMGRRRLTCDRSRIPVYRSCLPGQWCW